MEPVQKAQLKLAVRQMRRAVLIAVLEKKGAKFISLNVDQLLVLGKTDEEIYEQLMSQQTLLYKFRDWFRERRSKT